MAQPQDEQSPSGIDRSAIQSLLQQMGPSEADKHAARMHAILTAGLGMMQNANLNPIRAAGYGGLLGQQAYNQELQFGSQMRSQNTGQIAQLLPTLLRMQYIRAAQNAYGNPGGGVPGMSSPGAVTPEAGVSPATAAQFGPLNGMPPGARGMPPAPLSVPQGTPPTAIAGYTPPNWRTEMDPGLTQLTIGSGDPKLMVDTITKFSQDTPGRNGMVFSPVGRPKYQITDAGVQFFNQDGTPGRFVANGAANTTAAAQRAGAVAGATTGGQEAAKQPYAFDVGIPGPNGRPISGYRNSIFGQPTAAPQPYTGATQAAVDAGQIPPRGVSTKDWKAAMADAANNPGATLNYMDPSGAQTQSPMPGSSQAATGAVPVGGAPGTVLGPDPVAQAAKVEASKTAITTGGDLLKGMKEKQPIALSMISGLDNMSRLEAKGVYGGPAANQFTEGARWLNAMGLYSGDPSQIGNSDAYDSVLKQIARSGLKAFGGRTTNTEFLSVLASLPSRITTPEGREQMRTMLGAAALDELNQSKSADAYWQQTNGQKGLVGWQPPTPVTPANYWQTRVGVMGLQPSAKVQGNTTAAALVQKVLRSGDQKAIRELVLSGALQ